MQKACNYLNQCHTLAFVLVSSYFRVCCLQNSMTDANGVEIHCTEQTLFSSPQGVVEVTNGLSTTCTNVCIGQWLRCGEGVNTEDVILKNCHHLNVGYCSDLLCSRQTSPNQISNWIKYY